MARPVYAAPSVWQVPGDTTRGSSPRRHRLARGTAQHGWSQAFGRRCFPVVGPRVCCARRLPRPASSLMEGKTYPQELWITEPANRRFVRNSAGPAGLPKFSARKRSRPESHGDQPMEPPRARRVPQVRDRAGAEPRNRSATVMRARGATFVFAPSAGGLHSLPNGQHKHDAATTFILARGDSNAGQWTGRRAHHRQVLAR